MMRPTIPVLRGWHPDVLSAAGTQLDGMTQTFDTQMQTMVRQVDATQEHWKGEGAAAAAARTMGEQAAANHVSAAILGIIDALNAGDPTSLQRGSTRWRWSTTQWRPAAAWPTTGRSPHPLLPPPVSHCPASFSEAIKRFGKKYSTPTRVTGRLISAGHSMRSPRPMDGSQQR